MDNGRANAIRLIDAACRSENPIRMQEELQRAISELQRPYTIDPDAGMQAATMAALSARPPVAGNYVSAQPAPNDILVLPEAPVVVPGSVPSLPVRLEFSSGPGWLIGWRGIAIDFTAAAGAAGAFEQAVLQVEMTINDNQPVTRNGVAQDFVSFGNVFADANAFAPLFRYMTSKDIARFRFRNLQAAGGSDLVPHMAFAFLRDPRWC